MTFTCGWCDPSVTLLDRSLYLTHLKEVHRVLEEGLFRSVVLSATGCHYCDPFIPFDSFAKFKHHLLEVHKIRP